MHLVLAEYLLLDLILLLRDPQLLDAAAVWLDLFVAVLVLGEVLGSRDNAVEIAKLELIGSLEVAHHVIMILV